ncbi:MAG TPA: TadE family type IV pilus minor pilin [Nocardioidaceae bacterium]|nr:TadE family type IV pilus minor pilin [Nocardioidaceae bacterium]
MKRSGSRFMPQRRGCSGGAARSSSRGMVTAEAALVIPLLVALAAALAWVVALGVVQVRLVDAAREGARMAARGEAAAHVQQAALSAAPDGSTVRVHRSGDSWVAEVSVEVGTDLPLVGLLPAVAMSARAVSAAEPGSGTDVHG